MRGRRRFVLPADSAAEAALPDGMDVLPARSLLEVCAHLGGQAVLQPPTVSPTPTFPDYPDLAEVKGQAPGGNGESSSVVGARAAACRERQIARQGKPNARTIADLAGSEHVQSAHIAEAIHYRRGIAT